MPLTGFYEKMAGFLGLGPFLSFLMTSGYSTLVIRLLFLGCLTVYRIGVFSSFASGFHYLSADGAVHVCFFFLFPFWCFVAIGETALIKRR